MDVFAAKPRRLLLAALALAAGAHAGCASLGGLGSLIQPPRFSSADDRQAEIVLRGPSRDFPLGGAALRLHARVFNPNPFGLTLSTLAGDLYLEGDRAAAVDFPIGLPLVASGESDIPIDFAVGFDDVPGLARVVARAFSGQQLAYRLDGRIGVDAGALGRPTFGPMTILQGDVRVRR
jgi:late embryogenesis abundant protein